MDLFLDVAAVLSVLVKYGEFYSLELSVVRLWFLSVCWILQSC